MLKQFDSTGLLLLTGCVFASMVSADDVPPAQANAAPSVLVQCHGRLRDGVVAIGGETTGTTITFNKITWELQLPDQANRDFARKHHKEPVVVTGKLRQVAGTETKVRWIIDVAKLTEPETRDPADEAAQVTLRGLMRAKLAPKGNTPELVVAVNDQSWRLDFAMNPAVQASAVSLIGQTVLVTGSVNPLTSESSDDSSLPRDKTTYSVSVKSIETLTK